MAFKEKKRDQATRIKTYKFKVYPENQQKDFPPEIKEKIFEQSRLMNDLWNRLVEIRRATLAELSVIRREETDKLGRNLEAGKPLPSKELKNLSPAYLSRSQALWQSYEKQVKAVATDAHLIECLAWEMREDVFNRFDTAHRRNLKNGGEIKSIQSFIRHFHFPHRFTGGGRSAPLMHTGRSRKLFVESVPANFFESETYQNRLRRVVSGRFGVGIDDRLQIPFRLVMHRRVPETAKIKQAIFTGKLKNRAWEYFLVLIIEEPIQSNNLPADQAVAGIDLGWRKFEEYLRFGVIADSSGNLFELRLPHRLEKKQSLRRLERLLAKHGAGLPEYPQTWQDIEDWQRANDTATMQAKQAIKELKLPRTEITEPVLDNLTGTGKNGLRRLLQALEAGITDTEKTVHSAETDTGDTIKAVTLLIGWRDAYFARERAINYCRDRLINYRNYQYQLLVCWLRENYRQIALVADLPLQMIAVEMANVSLLEADGPVMRNAAKYRNRVALSELLRRIKQKKTAGANDWLRPVKGGRTETHCLTCGEPSPKTPNLVTVCEQGHRHDRDVQQAMNLRNELPAVNSASFIDIKIPDGLKNTILLIDNSDMKWD